MHSSKSNDSLSKDSKSYTQAPTVKVHSTRQSIPLALSPDTAVSNLSPLQLMQMQQTMGNQAIIQQMKSLSNELIVKNETVVQRVEEPALAPNETGMSDSLKQGIESMSGLDMSDVRVHRNSSAPAQINALAYAQGTDIHLAPGQEQHLPHEAWHVVQQKQGRVQPTMQLMQGLPVNDNEGLEREATEMGNQAAKVKMSDRPSHEYILNEQPFNLVVQRFSREDEQTIDAPENKYYYIGAMESHDPLSWLIDAVDIDLEIESITDTLESDEDATSINEDIELLEEYKNNIKLNITLLDKHCTQLAELIRQENKEASYKEALRINEIIKANNKLYTKLKQIFPRVKGGFSAKGRAHAIATSQLEEDGFNADDTYTKDISIDGKDVKSIYKKAGNKKVVESASTAIVKGKPYLSSTSEEIRLKDLAAYEKSVNSLQAEHTPPPLKDTPVAKPRAEGQYVAMAATNASGYALLSKIPDWNSSKWEWLHVRAASLGGVTNGSNLVVGNRDVNTHMMPFEANIKYLAALVAQYSHDLKELQVKYSIQGQHALAKHKVEFICIEWQIVPKEGKKNPNVFGQAVFRPLDGSSSISKIEVSKLEEQLKTSREKIKV
ncbi:eCIS core domain-containing protein [Paenibacillus nuruki]|uniref:eCIS core domain-containing protein n=1 Tax=Paenibacillus nuruki TaxID=1886670 RepID=UPI002805188F|nr:DUF4157 domain-containing protein [Paenibacillus nuruki]CAJ1317756.1 hypothetical protein AASFL403_21310 [Paenibacillus nuruki]